MRTQGNELELARYEAAQNAQSIREIPLSQFPIGPAKREAIRRALDGQDIYAYRPAFQAEYVIWDRQRDPATEARFSPQAWAAFHELALRDTLPTDGGAA